jgi:hypothetical protein
VTVAAVAGTSQPLFSFDAAVTSGILGNVAHSGRGSVTVSGLGFGVYEFTTSVAVEMGICHTSSWSSSTTVSCSTKQFPDVYGFSAITVGAVTGTGEPVFSFDSPVHSHGMPLNHPATQASWVTLSGLNFGHNDYTTSVQLARDPCWTTNWNSATTIQCDPPIGLRTTEYRLTVAAKVGTNRL